VAHTHNLDTKVLVHTLNLSGHRGATHNAEVSTVLQTWDGTLLLATRQHGHSTLHPHPAADRMAPDSTHHHHMVQWLDQPQAGGVLHRVLQQGLTTGGGGQEGEQATGDQALTGIGPAGGRGVWVST
jgi:hypothetical protein